MSWLRRGSAAGGEKEKGEMDKSSDATSTESNAGVSLLTMAVPHRLVAELVRIVGQVTDARKIWNEPLTYEELVELGERIGKFLLDLRDVLRPYRT